MKRATVIAVGFVVTMLAFGAMPAVAAPCVSGTMADYMSLSNCEIGGLRVSDFSYFGSNFDEFTEVPIPSTNVLVTPDESGLTFSTPIDGSEIPRLDGWRFAGIDFEARAQGRLRIVGASIELLSAFATTSAGEDGDAQVSLGIPAGALTAFIFAPFCWPEPERGEGATRCDSIPDYDPFTSTVEHLFDSGEFPPMRELDVSSAVNTINGIVYSYRIGLDLAQRDVPEPSEFAMFAVAVAAFASLGRRRRSIKE